MCVGVLVGHRGSRSSIESNEKARRCRVETAADLQPYQHHLTTLVFLTFFSLPPPALHTSKTPMDPFHHLTAYTNPYAHLLPPSPSPPPPPPLPAAAEPPDRDRERLPQWGHDETAVFLSIRAELDDTFLATKRNKALWEAISTRLLADGFHRTPDQCKSKWKNLVTRFKGSEAMSEQEARRHFPFHEEMRRIFAARVERAHALEKKKGKEVQPEDDDGEGEEDDEEEDGDEEAEESKGVATGASGMRRNKKKKKRKVAGAGEGEVEGMLREFMRRQLEMDERWMEAAEAREAERRAREAEWRRAMVALGQERLALVRRWREREEAWRARAEAREERRHQLVAALLAKLGQD